MSSKKVWIVCNVTHDGAWLDFRGYLKNGAEICSCNVNRTESKNSPYQAHLNGKWFCIVHFHVAGSVHEESLRTRLYREVENAARQKHVRYIWIEGQQETEDFWEEMGFVPSRTAAGVLLGMEKEL